MPTETETQLFGRSFHGRPRRTIGYAAVLVAGLIAPTLVTANGAAVLDNSTALTGFAPILPKADVGGSDVIRLAQSQGEAQLNVRIQQLEEQVRNLTGQVEGLQFQVTQMQTQIERLIEDNEFRFQALEGGAGKKPEAATQSDGATPSEVLPQAPESAAAPNTAAPADTALPAVAADGTTTGGDPATAGAELPMDNLGDSADPLLGVGIGEEGTLGTLPEGALTLDLSSQPNADAQAQYQAGYEAIVRGDYAFAEDQFRQFMALYPTDQQAPDAANWLGEALIHRAAYDEAADVLLTGFQNYPSSPAAPDLLLKLGMALYGAGEQETACRTFDEVAKRFPAQPAAFVMRLGEERAKAKCA